MCRPLPRGSNGDRMPYKLLLADDSVTIQRVIELTFAEEDVTVTAVSDGQQAIDLIQAAPPDIVLADVGMPKRDGYEVAAFIKNDPAFAHIPVLLLTGAFEPIDEDRAQSVRCDGVLAKPFEPQLLISRVKELLGGAAVPAAAAEPAAERAAVASEPLTAVQALLAAPGAGEPPIDEDATVRLARPPVFAEEDLRLDMASFETSHEPEPVPDATLDEYFDRLDAAFAHLTAGQPGPDTAPLAGSCGGRAEGRRRLAPLRWTTSRRRPQRSPWTCPTRSSPCSMPSGSTAPTRCVAATRSSRPASSCPARRSPGFHR